MVEGLGPADLVAALPFDLLPGQFARVRALYQVLIEATVAIYLYSTTALCRVAEIYEIVRPLLSAIECVSFAILAWITWK